MKILHIERNTLPNLGLNSTIELMVFPSSPYPVTFRLSGTISRVPDSLMHAWLGGMIWSWKGRPWVRSQIRQFLENEKMTNWLASNNNPCSLLNGERCINLVMRHYSIHFPYTLYTFSTFYAFMIQHCHTYYTTTKRTPSNDYVAQFRRLTS